MPTCIMAHPNRQAEAEHLAHSLHAPIIWDRGLGENDTGDRAWEHALTLDGEWVTVIQDDAQPIIGFLNHLEQGITNRPEDAQAFSWYLGTARPPQWQTRITKALNTDTAWLVCPQLLHGVAVTLHRSHVTPMLQAVHGSQKAYDYRIGHYLRRQRIPVYYPASSLVDHKDEPSLLGHDKEPRKAHRLGAPEWNQRTKAI